MGPFWSGVTSSHSALAIRGFYLAGNAPFCQGWCDMSERSSMRSSYAREALIMQPSGMGFSKLLLPSSHITFILLTTSISQFTSGLYFNATYPHARTQAFMYSTRRHPIKYFMTSQKTFSSLTAWPKLTQLWVKSRTGVRNSASSSQLVTMSYQTIGMPIHDQWTLEHGNHIGTGH